MEVIKSVYENQNDILRAILKLNELPFFECDLTYGNGSFYKEILPPIHRFDLDDKLENLTKVCSSTDTGLTDSLLGSVMFDPPFLTYVRASREGNGNMIMARRFSGYWRYDELEEHYKGTLREAHRILKNKGVMVFKCQDIIHNHKMHSTHCNVINWAEEIGFRLKDMFILAAKHRLPSPNRSGKQKHARIFHSYFLVLECKK